MSPWNAIGVPAGNGASTKRFDFAPLVQRWLLDANGKKTDSGLWFFFTNCLKEQTLDNLPLLSPLSSVLDPSQKALVLLQAQVSVLSEYSPEEVADVP